MNGQLDGLVRLGRDFGYGMRGGGYGSVVTGWGFPIGLLVAGLVFAGLVAAVVVLSVRLARRERRRPSEATEIVKARYARGEISKNEYEQLMKDLS